MTNKTRTHSLASVLGLLVIPAVLMLLAALAGGMLGKDPARHLVVVLAIGVMWHGLARRWLQKYAPEADYRLTRMCLLTLFVTLPGAHLLVFGLFALGGTNPISWFQPVVAGCLGILPLWFFYLGEL